MDQIRVVLVEDDLDWQKIMETLIGREQDLILVGCAATREEAIEISEAIYPQIDVFLVDINLTDNNLDGIYTALDLRERDSKAKVIMLTSMNDNEIIKKSFTAGAVNYVLKKDASDIPDLIRKTCSETSPVEALVEDYCRLKQEEQLRGLTSAEREVFELVEKGYSRPEMEKKLVKSDNTLKNQIKNILRKLGVTSTKEAVKRVKSGGLI